MRAYNRIELEKVARETGFIRDNLEKVIRLSNILEFLVSNDSLKGKVVLKGGTAINLTVFDMPRLSVDIDLDYCCNSDKDTMMADRAALIPVLKKTEKFDFEEAKANVISFLSKLLILGNAEGDFIDSFNQGEYKPELLFDDGEIIERIKEHPMALWKINNAE